ncbi:hypothetical protein [Taklimakanibacter lacteus]|uniref:hypothetical protein n=1 Tax=Taklimakanibacter lacteus TaxID=2268456 RepID=UPI000E66D0A7
MPDLSRDDTDLINSIMGIVRLCGSEGDRPSKELRADALNQLGYILYRVNEIAPDLFRRIESMLIQGLTPEDWETLQFAIKGDLPPSRPQIRKRRRGAA